MQDPGTLLGDHRLQHIAKHNNVPLAALDTIEAVLETVLPPQPPPSARVPTHGQALQVHRLVQELEVITPGRGANVLQCQFAYANGGQEVYAQCPHDKQQHDFSQAQRHGRLPRAVIQMATAYCGFCESPTCGGGFRAHVHFAVQPYCQFYPGIYHP